MTGPEWSDVVACGPTEAHVSGATFAARFGTTPWNWLAIVGAAQRVRFDPALAAETWYWGPLPFRTDYVGLRPDEDWVDAAKVMERAARVVRGAVPGDFLDIDRLAQVVAASLSNRTGIQVPDWAARAMLSREDALTTDPVDLAAGLLGVSATEYDRPEDGRTGFEWTLRQAQPGAPWAAGTCCSTDLWEWRVSRALQDSEGQLEKGDQPPLRVVVAGGDVDVFYDEVELRGLAAYEPRRDPFAHAVAMLHSFGEAVCALFVPGKPFFGLRRDESHVVWRLPTGRPCAAATVEAAGAVPPQVLERRVAIGSPGRAGPTVVVRVPRLRQWTVDVTAERVVLSRTDSEPMFPAVHVGHTRSTGTLAVASLAPDDSDVAIDLYGLPDTADPDACAALLDPANRCLQMTAPAGYLPVAVAVDDMELPVEIIIGLRPHAVYRAGSPPDPTTRLRFVIFDADRFRMHWPYRLPAQDPPLDDPEHLAVWLGFLPGAAAIPFDRHRAAWDLIQSALQHRLLSPDDRELYADALKTALARPDPSQIRAVVDAILRVPRHHRIGDDLAVDASRTVRWLRAALVLSGDDPLPRDVLPSPDDEDDGPDWPRP